ncbi:MULTISPECIES: nitroreductase family protein [unclassified Rhizobium]|uniref:nitroreductase family protein n=1 Tax=unclassified Rhizobium TaxID=2613769 RepID=UPI001FED600B|nr:MULTISPECIES: nitroreductase family protein [unclassified Rhizobium]
MRRSRPRQARRFTDREIPKEVLERVLSVASWAPSGSNIQPCNTSMVSGATLAEQVARRKTVAAGDPGRTRKQQDYQTG